MEGAKDGFEMLSGGNLGCYEEASPGNRKVKKAGVWE